MGSGIQSVGHRLPINGSEFALTSLPNSSSEEAKYIHRFISKEVNKPQALRTFVLANLNYRKPVDPEIDFLTLMKNFFSEQGQDIKGVRFELERFDESLNVKRRS